LPRPTLAAPGVRHTMTRVQLLQVSLRALDCPGYRPVPYKIYDTRYVTFHWNRVRKNQGKESKEVKMAKPKYPLFKCLHRGEKGFTLIELVVVVAIVGILAAVIIPNITKFLGVGQKAAAQGEMNTVQMAVYAAMAESGVAAIDDIVGPLSASNGEIDSTSGITITGALQGGEDELKGIWTIDSTGEIVYGEYPNPEKLEFGASYWEYDAGNWTHQLK
jgi:type IV pilus assembly protein PilA